MILLMLILTLYVLPIVGAYKYIQYSHSKGGEFQNLQPGIGDVIVLFIPVLNIILTVVLITGGWRDIDNRVKHNYDEFFKIKRDDHD